jgi:hypothetical protein
MKVLILLILVFISSCALPQDNADKDNNQTGSLNTSNNNSTVGSNNITDTNSLTKNYNGAGSSSEIPATSAISPTYMSNGAETCLQGSSQSIQTVVVGFSGGSYEVDIECNRRRDAKVLSDLGMKVAAVSRMCGNSDVWKSMFLSGTPCPILSRGKLIVGKRAYLMMKTAPETYIPDYGIETQSWYNIILGIGETNELEENDEGGKSLSVSERFRSSAS